MADLTLKDKTGAEIEKRLPGGKVKKKAKAEVVLETTTRSKKKCVTTIQGKTGSLPICTSRQECVGLVHPSSSQDNSRTYGFMLLSQMFIM